MQNHAFYRVFTCFLKLSNFQNFEFPGFSLISGVENADFFQGFLKKSKVLSLRGGLDHFCFLKKIRFLKMSKMVDFFLKQHLASS